MTADEFREVMETELAWRQEEFAFFKNQLNGIPDRQRDRYRKGLALILHEHLEGYVAVCLQNYIQYINEQQLIGREVSIRFLAAGMQKVLPKGGCQYPFSVERPDESLYRFYQQVDLMELAEDWKGRVLKLDDQIMDLEYGCGFAAVQKKLYRLGLPVDLFHTYQKDWDAFANRSSAIAQGIFRSGVTRQELAEWESKAERIASGVMRLLYQYVKHEKYRTGMDESTVRADHE